MVVVGEPAAEELIHYKSPKGMILIWFERWAVDSLVIL